MHKQTHMLIALLNKDNFIYFTASDCYRQLLMIFPNAICICSAVTIMIIKTTFGCKVFWLTMVLHSYRNDHNAYVVLTSQSRNHIVDRRFWETPETDDSEAQKVCSHIKVVSVWETGIGKIKLLNAYYVDSLIPN